MWVLSSTASAQRPRSGLTVTPTAPFYIPLFFPPTLSVEHLIGDGIRVVVKTETPDQNVIKTGEYREQQDIWRSKPRQDQDLIYIKEKCQRTMTHTCFD